MSQITLRTADLPSSFLDADHNGQIQMIRDAADAASIIATLKNQLERERMRTSIQKTTIEALTTTNKELTELITSTAVRRAHQ
jgi:hypothetical protein